MTPEPVWTLETPRLRLRRLLPGDLDDLYRLYHDPEVRRYFPEGVLSYEETREELEYFLHGHPERPDRYAELMRMTGLAPFMNRLAGRLSGGMKQKLGLVCTLIHAPELVILDELTYTMNYGYLDASQVLADIAARPPMQHVVVTGRGARGCGVVAHVIPEPRRPPFGGLLFGGANRDRTDDLLHAMQALSQLSYSPPEKGAQYSQAVLGSQWRRQ